MRHVLTNSFGFGGNDSSCIFSAYKGQGTGDRIQNSEFKIQGLKEEIICRDGACTVSSHINRPAYIKAASQISLQAPLSEQWFDEPVVPNTTNCDSQEANYSQFINPMAARRMGKLFKRAIATAVDVLQKGKCEQVDAIVTGTGLGCIEHTEKFLHAMLDNDEECLPPTHFMQSTHNTISSQMALHLKCHGYNCTYSHRGTSFDSGLLDVLTQMRLGDIHNALVCGHEEMTPDYFKLLGKIGYWKLEACDEEILRRHDSKGSFSGSCSLNLLLTDSPAADNLCAIRDMEMLYKPSSQQLDSALQRILQQNQLNINDISAVVMGLSGDQDNDEVYLNFAHQQCADTPIVWYKHLFGESYCASSFGVYTGAVILQKQAIPNHLIYNGKIVPNTPIKHILVYNHFQNKDHSLILLSSCLF